MIIREAAILLFSFQVFMSMMGGDKQGQTIVYHLIELLKRGNRLPQPMGCPSEVSYKVFILRTNQESNTLPSLRMC